MDVAILADDLTGAADSAVQCTGNQRLVMLALDTSTKLDAAVASYDLNSRDSSPERAAASVRAAVAALSSRRPTWWMKKIDSTLRGHVAAEVTAFLQATGVDLVICTPAYPALHRTVASGRLYRWWNVSTGSGVPIAPIFHAQHVIVESISLSQIHLGPQFVAGTLDACQTGSVVLCDGITDHDLDVVVDAGQRCHRQVAYAGSAGLMGALARLLYREADVPAPPLPASGPAACLAGSLNAVTRDQLDYLRRQGDASLTFVEVTLDGGTAPAVHEVLAAVHAGKSVIASTPAVRLDHPLVPPAQALAQLGATLLREGGVRRFVATGGDVARKLCAAFGATQFAVTGNVGEGVPCLEATLPDPVHLATKAGGFGEVDALARCLRYLRSA